MRRKNFPKIVAINIDGTSLNFESLFNDWHNKVYGLDFKVDEYKDKPFSKLLGITSDEVDKRILKFYKSPAFSRVPFVKGFKEFIYNLVYNQYSAYFITSRPENYKGPIPNLVRKYTLMNLNYFFEKKLFSNFHLLFSKPWDEPSSQIPSKGEICKLFKIPFMVDDSYSEALECEKNDIITFLVPSRYNYVEKNKDYIMNSKHIIPVRSLMDAFWQMQTTYNNIN